MSFKKYQEKSINNAEKLAKSNELKDKKKPEQLEFDFEDKSYGGTI